MRPVVRSVLGKTLQPVDSVQGSAKRPSGPESKKRLAGASLFVTEDRLRVDQ